MRTKAAVLLLSFCVGCHERPTTRTRTFVNQKDNLLIIEESTTYRWNGMSVSESELYGGLSDYAHQMAKGEKPPPITLRVPEGMMWRSTCRVLERCRFVGFNRLRFDDPVGSGVDLSTTRFGKPSPANDLGARIIKLPDGTNREDSTPFAVGEAVIVACDGTSRYTDVVRLLAYLQSHGITNILIADEPITDSAAPTAQRYGE